MQHVYCILINFVKHSKKVIVSDALINDNVINFLRSRKENNKTLFVENAFQKYKDKIAYRVRDEALFINTIYDSINDEKYFLFGSDSCDTATKLYYKCLENTLRRRTSLS